jgi:hypothetical protein
VQIDGTRLDKRALLGVIGSGLNWLFGTATDEQIETREKHIEHVENAVKIAGAAIQKRADHLASFAKIEAQNFDRMNRLFQSENHTIMAI